MIVIGLFREFVRKADTGPSIRDAVGGLSPEVALKVSKYLESWCAVIDFMEATQDPLNPKIFVPGGPSILTDGKWVWRLDLGYYVREYRIGLDLAFIDYVMFSDGRDVDCAELVPKFGATACEAMAIAERKFHAFDAY